MLPTPEGLVSSVLDRLTGRISTSSANGASITLSQLKQTVRQDLEDLLNSRICCQSPPAGLPELEDSLLNFGVPDFGSIALSSPDDRERFRQVVENAIRKFEPRLGSVRLILSDNADPEDRVLRFRIEAELRVEPMPEPVVFDSVVEPASQRIRVEKTI